ncbi:MAG TPA: hypothetical protein VGG51_13245 [Candidatus Cybelea sp.]
MTLSYGPIPATREDRGRFAAVRDARVLIYWPHGLGDWIHFGYVAPLLEPSNAYAMTRFGDDYVSVMENNPIVLPLYSGVATPESGSELGAADLGLVLRECNGKPLHLSLPPRLGAAVEAFGPERLLWTDYPETEGRTAFPFHTKARNLARLLVRPERLASFDLSRPLPSTLDFAVSREAQNRLDERLARFLPGRRLCVISRSGVTAARKNWGEGGEAREFVAALARQSPGWRFVSMENEDLGEAVTGFRSLFGDLDEPFARLFKALANRIDLFVGIPAGPLHLVMARGGIPVVGLWAAHHPDWYDEPNPSAVHLVGRFVRDRKFERRIATTSKPPSLQHRLRYLDSTGIPAAAVVEAALTVTA